MRFAILSRVQRLRGVARAGFLLLWGASLPVMADQSDTQTGITGTEGPDVISVTEPADTSAAVSTSTGEALDASATGVDALGGNDDVSNEISITTLASATAAVTEQPGKTVAAATSTGVSAGDGDDTVASHSLFTSTANAFGVYGAPLEYQPADPNAPPPKEIDLSITTTGKAVGVVTGGGNDSVTNDAALAVTALATSGGSANQLNATVQDSVNVKSASSSEATAKGVEAGAGNDSVANDGVMLNTATATSGAVAIALVAPQGTPVPDPQDPNAPPKPKKTQVKAESAATAKAGAVGIDTEDDSTEDSSEDTSPFGIDGLKITYHKTVSTVAGDDMVTNSVLLTNLATATSGAGSAAISDKVDGTVESSATSEATAEGTGIVSGGGNDTITNSGELLSTATATAGALSLSLEVGTPTDTSPAPPPPPGEAPKPPTPSEDKENKAKSDTSVTATARATGIDAEGSGQTETTDASAEITDGALVINYQKTVESLSGNDIVVNTGAIQALGTATAASENAAIVIASGGSTEAESKSKATSYGAAIATGGGDDSITNGGVLTSAATSNASALTLGLAVGKPQETTPPPGGSGTPAPAKPSKLTTSTNTGVEAAADAFGIDAEGSAITTTNTSQLSIGTDGLSLSVGQSKTGTTGNDTVVNDGVVTSTALANASSTDAAIELQAAGSVNSESQAQAKATSTGIFTGAGNDSITNHVLLTAGATAGASALSLGITVTKPPEQAPADGGTTPPDPNAKKDKSNVKVQAGATAQATAAGVDAEGQDEDTTRSASLTIGGNGLDLSLERSSTSSAGADTVVNSGVVDAHADATSGALAAGIAINAAGSIDADATSKAEARSGGILTGGGADSVDNTVLIGSHANATAGALSIAVSVSQPTDANGEKPSTLDKLKDVFATAHSVANAEATSRSSGIDTEGDAHARNETLTLGISGDGLTTTYVADTTSLAGDDTVTNSGAVLVSAGSLAGAGAAEVKVETEGTASAEANAKARSTSGAVLTGGGNDTVTNSGALTSTAISTAGALAVSFTKTGGLGAEAKSDASANSDARSVGIGTDAAEETRHTEVSLGITADGFDLAASDSVTAGTGADHITNDGLVSATAAATSGAAGAAISMDGSASSDITATSTSRANGIDAGGGADVIGNNGLLTSTSTAASNALSVAFGQKGGEKTKSKEKAEASSTADSSAIGISGDSGANVLTTATLKLDSNGLAVTGKRESTAATGDDAITNHGGIVATATSTDGAEAASIAIDGVATAETKATAKSRSTAIDAGGGKDNVLSDGELSAAATSTAYTLAASIGEKTGTSGSARTKVSSDTTAEAISTGIATDGASRNETLDGHLTIDDSGLDFGLKTTSAAVTGDDVLDNRNTVTSTASATTGSLAVALSIKGGANASANSAASADSLGLDTGGGADTVTNSGDLTAGATATAATLNAAISTEGTAISNSSLMGAGTTASSRAIGISTAGLDQAKSFDTTDSINFDDIGVQARLEWLTDGITADGKDSVTNTGSVTVTSDALAPRLNVGITGKGVAVSMGRASSESYASGIDTGNLDDTIDNSGTLSATATSTAVLANVAVSAKGLAVAANAVWDGGTEATATATGINADSGSKTTTVIAAEANSDVAKVRYDKSVENASGNDEVSNSGSITSHAEALAPSLNVGVVAGTGLSVAVSTATATATSTAIRGGDGDDLLDNSGTLDSSAAATAAAANVAVTNQGVAAAADAVWDGGTKANATAIGIAGDGGDRTHSNFIAVGTDGVSHDATGVLADGADTITNSGGITTQSDATALSASVAVALTGVGAATATSTATSRASAIDAGAGTAVDSVSNSGHLTATANAFAAAASVSVTNTGAALSADSVWDDGTTADARARGIDVGSGAETVTNEGAIDTTASAITASAAVSVAITGVAGAVATSTGKADATAIDASAGNDADTITNSGDLSATASSLAASAAVSFTTAGVAVSADSVWDGGTTADARARGIDVGDAADTVTNTGDITTSGDATAVSVTASVAISGLAGAVSTSTAKSNVAAIDAGTDAAADTVTNGGVLSATSDAEAASAAVSFTAAGVALAGGSAWDGGTHSESNASSILLGAGADEVTNEGALTADSTARSTGIAVSVAVEGVAGAITAATADSTATGIDAAAGDDEVASHADITATSLADANTISAAGTEFGVSVAGNNSWDGGATSTATSTGISGGAGLDGLDNSGDIASHATAISPSVAVSFTVGGVAAAVSTATSNANARAIDGGGDKDEIDNTGALTVNADSNAVAVSVAVTGVGVGLAADAVWDGGTTANAQAAGIGGGAGDDDIRNTTSAGTIDATANATATSVAASVTGGGFAGSISTSTANAEGTAIDGGEGNDTIFNDSTVAGHADAQGTSVSVSIVGSGGAFAGDTFWDGGTKGNATAIGIAGGAGNDSLTNAGDVTADSEAHTFSASVAASLSSGGGLTGAVAASTSTANATALDAGTGDDELTNNATLHADSYAAADGVSVAFAPAGGALSGSFDAATRANSHATGMAGAEGTDTLTNADGASISLDSTAVSRNLAVSLTLAGVADANANAISTAEGLGIDGGDGVDALHNEGLISGTIDSTATGRAIAIAGAGLGNASANSTGQATGAGLAGGAGDDQLENLGVVDLTFDAAATGQAISAAPAGAALSDASADSIVDASGQRGDEGADTLLNSGTIRIDAGASTTTRSISAAQLGVAIAAANSTATAEAAGIAGGDANDSITNDANGSVDVLATANVNAGSASVAVGGYTSSEARTVTSVLATGLAGDDGDDSMTNAGQVSVRGRSLSTAISGSATVSGAANARAGTEVETTAIGIDGGAGVDTIVNSGTLVVGPGDGTDLWMAKLVTGAASIGIFGGVDAQSAAYARTTSIGIAGGSENDSIENTGTVSVTANARSDTGSGALSIFGSSSGGGKSGAFTLATGLDGGSGDDLLATGSALTVTAEALLTQTGTSFTFGGSGAAGAELEAGTDAFGVSGGDGNDEIHTAGTIDINAKSTLTSSGGGDTVFGTSATAGTSGARTHAVGIDGGAGDDNIDNAAQLSLSATSALSMSNASYTFGGTGAAGGTLAATTSVDGIMGGSGADHVTNSGAITIDALSTLTSGGGSETTFGGSSSSVTSGGIAEARGLAGGDGDDLVENLATGTIEITARSKVDADSMSYTFGGSSGAANTLTGDTSAIGMQGAGGGDRLFSDGLLTVTADTSLTSTGGAKATFTGSGNDATGVSVATSQAVGIDGGEGDDVIASRGHTIVSAKTVAEAQNNASSSASFTSDEVAGSISDATAEAVGLAGADGVNSLTNDKDGHLIVTADSTGYALSYSSGATFSFDGDGESRADSTAHSTATGIAATDGNNTVVNNGQIDVTATAGTEKDLTTTLLVYRLQGDDDPNSTPPAPVAETVKALPDLSTAENQQKYAPGTIVYCMSKDCVVAPQVNSGGNHYVSTVDSGGVYSWVPVAAVDALPDLSDPAVRQAYANGQIVACTATACREDPEVQASATYYQVKVTPTGNPPVDVYSWQGFDGLVIEVSVDVTEGSFPSYAAANGNGLDGDGLANAVGLSRADARGIQLGDGNNSVQSNGMSVQAIADTVVNAASDGDVVGNATGKVTTSAIARAVGIELGNGVNGVVNAGNMQVTATPSSQAYSEVSAGGGICIWFFGWWCGGKGTPDAQATANFDAEAIGILAGDGGNAITNDGTIHVSAAPDVAVDARRSDAEYAARTYGDGTPALTVVANSSAVGIGTGAGNDVVTNNGEILVEAKDVLSGCSAGNCGLPAGAQATLSAIGIRTGDGDDTVTNNGEIEALVHNAGVPSSGIGIDLGLGNDSLTLGNGSEIVGSVALGDGDDVLTLSGTPSIVDATGTPLNVDAGAGTDTLVLDGAGAYGGTPLSIERASKIAGGTYSLPSLATVQQLTIDDGTLHLDSGYLFDPAGAFDTLIYADGRNGQLDVTGSASLGGAFTVEKLGDTYIADGTRYSVVLAGDGISGAFSTVALPESLPLLSYELETSPNAVDVVAVARPFDAVTENPLYKRIAANLYSIAPTSTGDLAKVFGTMQSMTGDFDTAFASFSPEAHLATSGDTLVNVRQMTRLLQGHLGDSRLQYRKAPYLRAPSGSFAFAGGSGGISSFQFSFGPQAFNATQLTDLPANGLPAAAPAPRRTGRSQVWLLGLNGDSKNDAVGGYSPFETDTNGYLLGYDMRAGEQWLVGANIGRARTDVTSNALAARGDISAWLGSAYATWFDEKRYLEAGLSYGKQSFSDSRTLSIGTLERAAASEHDGKALTAFIGGGLEYGTERWSIEPFASFYYLNAKEDAFEETGADSLNQIIAARSAQALHGEAGANLSLLREMRRGILDWHATLALGYDFGIDDGSITYALAGNPASAFTIGDRESARTSAVYGAGVSWLGEQSTLSLDYGGQKSADHREQFLSARVTIRF